MRRTDQGRGGGRGKGIRGGGREGGIRGGAADAEDESEERRGLETTTTEKVKVKSTVAQGQRAGSHAG